MKTIITAALVSAFIASAGMANANEYVTDPLLKDLAVQGNVINPNGNLGGR